MNASGSLSRRQLLGASGAAGAAALAAGCGVLSGKPTTLQEAGLTIDHTDVPILEHLLRLEYHLSYAYTASLPRLAGYGAHVDRWFLHDELEHIGTISKLLRRGHIKPNTSAGAFPLGHASTVSEVLTLLHSLEADAIRAYAHAVANFSNGNLRAVAASIMANEAQHISLVRRAMGLEPVPSALLTANE